jgi:glutaredoxin-related protein
MDMETMTGGKQQKKSASCDIKKFEATKEARADSPPRKCKSLEDQPVKLINHTIALLKESEAVLFGHEQCGYCKKQVELFTEPTDNKKALKGIYVNCKENQEQCQDIRGYPTWNIAGKSFVGLHNVSDLCQIAELAVEDRSESLPPKSPEKQTCKTVEDDPKKLTKHTLDLLRESEASFYGHERCGYCKKQTELFVKHSDEKTPLKEIYVNCQNEPDRCRDISGYPTWEIAGKTFVGYHDMKDLCQIAELAIEDKEVSLGHK